MITSGQGWGRTADFPILSVPVGGSGEGSIHEDQQASDLRFYSGQGRGRTADLPIFRRPLDVTLLGR
jgi:hypothetical protein